MASEEKKQLSLTNRFSLNNCCQNIQVNNDQEPAQAGLLTASNRRVGIIINVLIPFNQKEIIIKKNIKFLDTGL